MSQIVMLIKNTSSRKAEMIAHIHSQLAMDVCEVSSGEEALRHLVNEKLAQPDVVLFDIGSDAFAGQTIRAIRSLRNDLQIIALMNHAHIDDASGILTSGAGDMLLMPFNSVQLTVAIRNALLRRNLQIEARHAWKSERIGLEDIDAQSAALQATLFLAKKIADSAAPVVLEGAPGAGHEMLARAIHGSSSRRHAPFKVIDCALLGEAEAHIKLFGDTDERGAMAEVKNGTLLIRNVSALDEATRRRIFIASDDRHVLHATRPEERFEGRLIFAVHDAARRASSQEKHEISDFFSVLNALPVSLPYLREIPEDIPMLALLHCRRYSALEGKTITGISAPAMQMLREISWPGNMEQLSQGIFNAVMCCQSNELQVTDFRYLFRPQKGTVSQLPIGQKTPDADGSPQHLDGLLRCVDERGKIKRLQDVEEEVIRYALSRYSGHMSDVARYLGIGRSTLYRKISSMDER